MTIEPFTEHRTLVMFVSVVARSNFECEGRTYTSGGGLYDTPPQLELSFHR